MNTIVWFLLIIPLHLIALQKEPFLPAPYTFTFKNTYAYQYIPAIDQSTNPIDFHSHNNFYYSSLSGSFKEGQALFFELGFNSSSQSNFNFLQTTLEYRIALLNELLGDPLSVQIAPVITVVPHYRVTDVNTPYQNVFNVSTILSFGRELDNGGEWIANFFGAAQGGVSSSSGPFIELELQGSAKFINSYVLMFSLQELVGFGKNKVVNVALFKGWSEISHQSTRINTSFSYITSVYGVIELKYSYGLFSQSYFQDDSSLIVSYTYPFSP